MVFNRQTGARALVLLMASAVCGLASADGWQTYRHDMARSGIAGQNLSTPLQLDWTFVSTSPPQPAWPGPARRDAWHKTENMRARVIFDWAFHVVASEEAVYFGSSADDKVYCLDAETGEERWHFFTEAPIRLAPTLYDGKLYVGSDDGYVYCLNAESGEPVWKHRAGPSDLRVAGNERIMSVWPVRTGIVVDSDIAYFCAGLFPNEGVFLCAVNAQTGEPIWKQGVSDHPPQGYLLASPTRLYVPTGRGTPAVFDRKTGEFLHSMGGSGGTFALLTGDMLIYGPGKTGQLDTFATESSDQLASFNGNQMIVTPDRSYLHGDSELSALDRRRHSELLKERGAVKKKHDQIETFLKELDKKIKAAGDAGEKKTLEAESAKRKKEFEELKVEIGLLSDKLPACLLWKKACRYPYSLVLAQETFFAGGTGGVAAFRAKDGEELWQSPVDGRALELALIPDRLLVSTDKGRIYCFRAN